MSPESLQAPVFSVLPPAGASGPAARAGRRSGKIIDRSEDEVSPAIDDDADGRPGW